MTDFLVRVITPRTDSNNVRESREKIITLPATPRMSDEIFMPNGKFLPVSRLRFRPDQRMEVLLENVWEAIDYDFSKLDAFITMLEADGYSDTNLWDEPTPDPDPEP